MTQTTTRRPTTSRQAIRMAEKAGIKTSRVIVEKSHRTFEVRSEHAARRIAKATGWGYFGTAAGTFVMTAECSGIDADNCR